MSSLRQGLSRLYGRAAGAVYWRLPYGLRRRIVDPSRVDLSIPESLVAEILKRRVLFIHVPKTAGMSVQHSLFGDLIFAHQSLRQYELVLGRKTLATLFKFCFVRNPWDRLVSAWLYFRDIQCGKAPPAPRAAQWFAENIARFSDFETFVLRWVSKRNVKDAFPHFRPQVSFLRDTRGRIDFDVLGRFEYLDDDFREIARRLGCPAALQSRNRTSSRESTSYRKYYTAQTAEIAASAYADDVADFGYTF